MTTAPLQLFDALPSHIEDALRASIQRFGVLVPVVKDQQGRIIDGHHRSRIADQLGIKYRIDVMQVASDEEAREIARTLNSDRRQLTEDQRKEIVRVLREQGHSVRAIAGALGVGKSTVDRDVSGLSRAGQLEEPDRVVRQGGGSYPAKRPTVVAAKNEKEAERAQEALTLVPDSGAGRVYDVKRIERIARETAAELKRAEPIEPVTVVADIDLRHGDFREILADVEPGTVDAIITDPPYPGEFVCLFVDLSQLAARLLKPTGVLAVMCGQYYLPEYIASLGDSMRYRWCGAYIAQGARTRVHAAKVGTGWKPILLYSQNEASRDDLDFLLDDLFDDAVGTTDGVDKEFHHWGQSVPGTAELVERLSKPGNLIVDPFLGGGTTAVACKQLGRRFIGCDIDAAAVTTSRKRLT